MRANPFGPASFSLYLKFAKAVFFLAVHDRILSSSPIEHLKGEQPGKPIRQTLRIEEFRTIVENIRVQMFNADAQDSANFVEFIGLAGLGQAEANSRRWGDIDWQKNRLTTFRHKTSQRFVMPMFPQLRPLLERLRQERRGIRPARTACLPSRTPRTRHKLRARD